MIVQASDRDALEMAIIENVQRADLNPIEEAAGYERLMAEFSYAQSDLAQMIGKSRSHIANMLRLMKLPDSVKELLRNGSLSAGHGRALLSVEDPEQVALRAVERAARQGTAVHRGAVVLVGMKPMHHARKSRQSMKRRLTRTPTHGRWSGCLRMRWACPSI